MERLAASLVASDAWVNPAAWVVVPTATRQGPARADLAERYGVLSNRGLDRLTPHQAQHHLVLAGQAPALTGRERTSPSRLPCDGQHG